MQSRNQTFVVGIVANVIAVVLVLLPPSQRDKILSVVLQLFFAGSGRQTKLSKGKKSLGIPNELILIGTGISIYLLTSQKYRLINNWKKA